MTSRNSVALVVEEPEWRKRGIGLPALRNAAQLALLRVTLEQKFVLPDKDKKCSPRGGGGSGINAPRPPWTPSPAGMTCKGDSPDRARVAARLTVMLSNDERLRGLNARFRGKDSATNVLAFPAAGRPDGYLGDVAVALETAEREAKKAGIGLYAHAMHLTVHGVLHLLGYDHLRAAEARIMERREILILDELGLANPYARAAAQ